MMVAVLLWFGLLLSKPQWLSHDNRISVMWMELLTEQVVVGVSLVFEGESTITDVIEVLQPLEVRHRHTTGIQVHVLK